MRILIMMVLACLCMSAESYQPPKEKLNIVVAIAEQNGVCNASDIGFTITSSYAKIDDVKKKASSRLKKRNPSLSNVRLINNKIKKKHLGDHVVILSGTGLHKQCLKNSFGVGFGANEKVAFELAKKDLKKQNKYWDGKFKVVRNEKITPKK